ncbi:MAG: beta-N-acetylglucosaminidase domain-containing protein [Bacteroidaceae bacterium]
MKKTILFFLLLLWSITQHYSNAYTIYPIPQKIEMGSSVISPTATMHLVYETGVSLTTQHRLEEVLTKAGFGFTKGSTPQDDFTTILVGIAGSKEVADQYATTHGIFKTLFDASPNHFDPYLLEINTHHTNGDILILGNSEGSAYYAMASLEQLLEQANPTLSTLTINDYAHTKYRGIVEGFYGHPYSVANKLSLLEYCKRYKLNTYVYGPKSDPYHLGKWRDDYPTQLTEKERFMGLITQADLKKIAAKAKACHVNFIWAAHPALENGISFSNSSAMESGIDALMDKFAHLHQLGIRSFGVFIDDMTYTPSGGMQAYLANEVQKRLRSTYNSTSEMLEQVTPLFFVPTAYALNYGSSSTLNALKEVDAAVEIAFTGYDCFSNIRGSACADMAQRVGRNAVMWWNNPVNDDKDEWLYLHGLTTRWSIEDSAPISSLHGLLLNPMNQAQSSKIALFGGADYAWNPALFNAEANWKASFSSLFTTVAIRSAFQLFVDMVSSYSKTGKGEKYADLYAAFRQSYPSVQVPAIANQLQALFEQANAACHVLQQLKESNNEEERLFYAEAKSWISKVEHATSIGAQTLRLISAKEGTFLWSDYLKLQEKAATYHTHPLSQLSVLEGSGTTTHEVMKEAQPTPKGLDPFIDFLIERLPQLAPELPPRHQEKEVITNLSNLEGLSLVDGDPLILSGLQHLFLKQGEYIGIDLKNIYSLRIDASAWHLPLVLQYSMNGKNWATYLSDSETVEAAYCRILNPDTSSIELSIDQLTLHLTGGIAPEIIDVSTNMSTYQTYIIQNSIDKDKSTFFWSDSAQKVGDYITFTLSAFTPLDRIELQFNAHDKITGTALLELSADGVAWDELARFTSTDLSSNHLFRCSAQGRSAKQVRLYLASVSSDLWFQLADFSIIGSSTTSICEDHTSAPVFALTDRDLLTSYSCKEKGTLLYHFIENIATEQLDIYSKGNYASVDNCATLHLFDDGEWHLLGKLTSAYQQFDVSLYTSPTLLKIEWGSSCLLDLFEIVPIGSPYVEPAGNWDGVTTDLLRASLTIRRSAGMLFVSSPYPLKNCSFTTLDGMHIACPKVDRKTVRVGTVGHNFLLFTASLSNNELVQKKIIIL